MTDLAQIVALATPIATAIAGAAALIWRTQRADVAALAAKVDAADAKRDEYHAAALAQLNGQVASAREDAAKLTAALTSTTEALRANSELLRAVEDALADAREERASAAPAPLRKGGR